MKSTHSSWILGTLLSVSGLALAADAPAVSSPTPQNTTAAPAATPATTAPTTAASATKAASMPFSNPQEKVSYSIGIDIGRNFAAQGIGVDSKPFMQGLQDGLKGQSALTDTEIRDTLTAFQQDLLQKRAEELKKLAQANKTAGDAFLAANKQKKDVVTLKSGLQYRVITEGKGATPTAQDYVTTQYRGRLIDGTEFDSSYARNEPAVFPVSGMIPGWTEALQLMKVGSKWELVIPPELAYGEYGAGGKIGPNATLVFEVELLGVQPPEKTEPAKAEEEKPAAKTTDKSGKKAK